MGVWLVGSQSVDTFAMRSPSVQVRAVVQVASGTGNAWVPHIGVFHCSLQAAAHCLRNGRSCICSPTQRLGRTCCTNSSSLLYSATRVRFARWPQKLAATSSKLSKVWMLYDVNVIAMLIVY